VRIFLDANILFSAAHSPEGGARELFRLAAAGRCALFSSPHAMLEARRNLAVKSETGSSHLEGLVVSVRLVPDAGPKLVSRARSFGLPENDGPILAAAIAAGVDLLVTGDRKHFGHLFGSSVGRVRIVTLVEALEALIAP
jgi:predicted nucleic acid-binding protein